MEATTGPSIGHQGAWRAEALPVVLAPLWLAGWQVHLWRWKRFPPSSIDGSLKQEQAKVGTFSANPNRDKDVMVERLTEAKTRADCPPKIGEGRCCSVAPNCEDRSLCEWQS